MSLRADIRQLPRQCWFLFAGTVVNRFGGFVLLFLVLYLKSLGYSPAQAGMVMSAYGIGGLGASLMGGYLADKFGRRNTIVLSMFASSAAIMGLAHSHTLVTMFIFTGLTGLTADLYRPAASALLTDLTQREQRVTAFAVYRLAINLGFGLGPAVGGLLADRSFYYIFVGDAATSVVFGIVAWATLSNNVVPHDPTQRRGEALRTIVTDWRLMLFLVASVFSALIFMQSFATLPLYITFLGFSNATFGMLMSINGLLITFTELAITAYTKTRPTRSVMMMGCLLQTIGFGLTAWATSVPLLAMTVVIWTVGEMVFFPVAAAHVANVAPDNMRGRYQGAYTFTFAIGAVLAPIAGTALYDVSPRLVWYACVALGLAATSLLGAALTRR